MKEINKTKQELIHELAALQRLMNESKESETEFKRIEELLYKSEREKGAILNAMFEYVLLVNKDLKIIWVNGAVCRQFKVDHDELKGKNCYGIFAQLEEPCEKCTAKRAMEIGRPITIEDIRFPAFPGKRWSVRHYPVDNDECMAVYTDITESKRAAEALLVEQKQKDAILAGLKESEEKYRNLFEDSRDAILVISKEGKITDANQACISLLGITRKEHDRLNMWDYIVAPRAKERFIRRMGKIKAMVEYPTRLRRKDGSEIDCLVTVSMKYAPDGSVWGYQGIIRNITEKKKLEKELLEMGEREQRRIGQDLHDGLGQLLTGIALKSKSLAQSLKKKSLAEAKHAERLTELANDAINQTRNLVKGLVPVNLQAGGILATLKEMGDSISITHGISCSLNFNCTKIKCDTLTANQLYRIAQEAVINVVKHSQARQILINLDEGDDKIVLSIKDDGIGFSLDQKVSGGRGLHIMQYRANMIDATLRIRQNTEGGMTITCVVPKKRQQPVHIYT